MTQIGIMIEGQEGLSWERWRRICADVDSLGFASLRRSDHLISLMGGESRDCIDCWASLTAAAEWTKTIEFGPMVSPLTFYEPAVLARRATAVDLLSGGRLIFGIGAGWNQNEHEVFRVPFLDLKGRMDRVEEGVAIIRNAWARSSPKPPRNGVIPLLMGGIGEKRHLPLVAREAAEWNFNGLDLDTYRHKRQVLDKCCKEVGRDPSEIRYSVMTTYIVGRDRNELRERALELQKVLPSLAGMTADQVLERMGQRAFVGTPEEIAQRMREHSKSGVDLYMLQHFVLDDVDALRLLAEEVIPAVA